MTERYENIDGDGHCRKSNILDLSLKPDKWYKTLPSDEMLLGMRPWEASFLYVTMRQCKRISAAYFSVISLIFLSLFC